METFGYTAGCPGCRAANRGTTASNHSEECRNRFAEELENVGDERLVREAERLFEYLEEEENTKKKARASEGSGECVVQWAGAGRRRSTEKQRRSPDGNGLRRQCSGDR